MEYQQHANIIVNVSLMVGRLVFNLKIREAFIFYPILLLQSICQEEAHAVKPNCTSRHVSSISGSIACDMILCKSLAFKRH